MAKTDLSADFLRENLHYDPDTGIFTRLNTRQHSRWCGKPAGHTDKLGYVRIRLMDGKIHKAHRLAWLYVYGVNPSGEIDHMDGNPSNNRIANLRDVDRSANRQNVKQASANNTHGAFGVSKRKSGRWQSAITVNGKRRHLGSFADRCDAEAAYISAKLKHHPYYSPPQ